MSNQFQKPTWTLLLFFLGYFACPAFAQVELRSDSSHVETGNPLQLHFRFPVTLGKPDSLHFDLWDALLPRQNILNQTDWESDGQFFTKTITTLFFDEDTLELPSLPVALRHNDTIYCNPLQILVTATPSPDDLNDMAPIKDIHREEIDWTDFIPWILGVLAVLGLLAFLYWLAKRKSKARMQSRMIEIPADQLALRKLELLGAKKLTAHGFIKEHYAELTFILREYLEKRFGIPALESTSEETIGYLKKGEFPAPLMKPLQTLLEQADLAKFAKIIPPESFHQEAFDLANKLILETGPAPEPPITN